MHFSTCLWKSQRVMDKFFKESEKSWWHGNIPKKVGSPVGEVYCESGKTELKHYSDDKLFASEVLQPAETEVFANIFRLRLLTVFLRSRERTATKKRPSACKIREQETLNLGISYFEAKVLSKLRLLCIAFTVFITPGYIKRPVHIARACVLKCIMHTHVTCLIDM